MQQGVFVVFAPLHLEDSLQQTNKLRHPSLFHERVDPLDRLIPEQKAKLVKFTDLYLLRLGGILQVLYEFCRQSILRSLGN